MSRNMPRRTYVNYNYNNSSNAYAYAYEQYEEEYRQKEKIKEELRKEKSLRVEMSMHRLKFFAAVTVVFVGSFLLMTGQAAVAKQRVDNEKAAAELSELKSTNNTLQSEISDSADLAYIEKEAKERLGMAPPQSYQIIYIDVPKQSYTVQYENTVSEADDSFDFKEFAKIMKENVMQFLN